MAEQGLPYKPRIFKQGLALVLIPLSVGTCVLLFVNQLWLSAQKVTLQQSQQNRIVEQLTDILKRWSILSGTTFAGAVEKDLHEVIKKSYPWLDFGFYELKQTTKDFPKTYANVLHLEEIAHSEIQACSNLPQSDEGLTLTLAQQLPKTLGKIYQLRSEVKRMLTVELVELQNIREKQSRSFEAMKLYAYVFMGGNILLAVLIVWLFSKTMGDRMRVLSANAAALPRASKHHLTGNDELGYLDRVLSETASTLQNAAEHRRSILGMVAHDMRSPLMSSQASIQMIEEIGGDYPDGAYETLEIANNQLASILSFVQGLLKVQKAADEGEDSDNNAISTEVSAPSGEFIESTSVKTTATVRAGLASFLTRPKIFHKGLLVALAPIVMQIGFLVFINSELTNTEKLAAGEQRCTDINIAHSIMRMDMIRASTVRGIYLLTSSKTAEQLANKIFADIEKEYDKLARIVGPDKEWQDYVALAKINAQHQIGRIMSVTPASDAGEKYAAFEEISELKQRSQEAYVSRQKGNALLAKNIAELHAMEAQQRNLASLISNVIGLAVLANLLVSLGMLYFFTKDITDRIKILVSNATKIGRGEDLTAQAAGTDEIAYLGLVLHQAKNQLNSASQQRALMMASLAQQMRIPLIAARADLDKFYTIAAQKMKESTKKHLSRAQNNIDRVLRLVDDLLTMESLESGKVALELSSCDIQTIAEEALSTVSSLSRKKSISLINECDSTNLYADKSRLAQVLINYLSNAIKFSPEQSVIRVSSSKTAEKLRISVIDQGPGMDENTRNQVFEKFFQANTEQKKEGFGLGLAICQLIVQSHGGTLGVDSEPGKGSTFWFELPISAASEQAPSASEILMGNPLSRHQI